MHIELQHGIAVEPGTFSAVIAPEEVIISMINTNRDLQRFLILFIGGNFSRILSDATNRTATNFEVCRAFQLLARGADRVYYLSRVQDDGGPHPYRSTRSGRARGWDDRSRQKTLDKWAGVPKAAGAGTTTFFGDPSIWFFHRNFPATTKYIY